MATSINLVECMLHRNRFGPTTMWTTPKDGIKGSEHHNVVTAYYEVGTVLSLWHAGRTSGSLKGWTELVYARFDEHAAGTPSEFQVVSPALITNLFDMGHDPAQVECGAFGVITISVMTDDYYGWFWSGGVPPIDLVASSTFVATTNVATDGSVAALTGFYAATDAANDQALKLAGAGIAQMGFALVIDV